MKPEKKGSKNRGKARRNVAKLHRKVRNQRKSFSHQLSSELVATYSIIAVEDLEIEQMTKSARGSVEAPGKDVKRKAALNRSLLDGSFGALYKMLEYKAEEAGIEIVKVDPKYTSQDCALCDKRVPKTLKDRTHLCPSCGFTADRDYNAALNILFRALARLTGLEQIDCNKRISILSKTGHHNHIQHAA